MKDDQFYILCDFDNESSVQQQDKTESKPIQVAYASWLIFDEERPQKPIADLIHDKEQVLLKWPSNYDVKSKEVMSKRSDIKYGQAVATILAQSDDWATIVEASKSVEKFGVPFPTRGMRATLAKRQDDVKVSLCRAPKKRKTQDKVFQELESGTSSATQKKLRLGNNTSADAESSAAENDGTRESDSDDGVALATYVAEKSKLKKKNQTIKQESRKYTKKLLDDNGSSDSDDISSSYSPSNNIIISQRNLILEAENKKLKQELRALRASELIAKTDFEKIKDDVQVLLSSAKSATTLVDELKTLKKVVADLKVDMKHLQSRTNEYVSKSKCEPKKHGVHLSQNKNSIKTFLSSKPSTDKMIEKVSSSLSSKLAMEKGDEDKPSTSAHGTDCETIGPHEKPIISDPENVSANPQVSKSISLEIKEEDPSEANEGGYDNLDDEKVDFQIDENFKKVEVSHQLSSYDPESALRAEASPKPKFIATAVSKISIKQKSTKPKGLGLRPEPVYDPKAVFKFGVVSLTGEELARCKHSGKVSHLVSDLFVKIFTPDEMALGNLTGKTPNGHKKYVVKKKLDEERVKSIVDYVATFLAKEVSREQVANEVVKAISVKLNNYMKTEEAKKIVQNYIRENPDQLVTIKEGDGNQTAN